ncbi:MAG: GGDEF domain-containing protein [Lachnospiraceae bacterium]
MNEDELREENADLKNRLKNMENALKMSQRRYEIAVSFSDITIFDYNIKTKRILTQPEDFEIFGMSAVFEEGIEDVIDSGIIAERSKNDIRELYQKIDAGVPSAYATIYANAVNGEERTLELKMVTIFDQNGTPAYAVGVRKDITESIKFHKEKEYSDLFAAEFNFIYEANVTRDKILRYHNKWAEEIGIDLADTLSDSLKFICEHVIYKEDIKLFNKKHSRKSILAAFKRGEHIITFEYRKWIKEKGYQWFEARLNIIKDDMNGDIYIRAYNLNIDEKKKTELALLHMAQHDLMTGFYNKNTTAEKIIDFLKSKEGKRGSHIFFVIDLDHFKIVNDKFGHAFGDVVLSQTSAKIASFFRNTDILGRIGGDEFVVFMKNIQDDTIAARKAQEICEGVSEVYVRNNMKYKVTVSVGIAIYNQHGRTYDELYKHSDAALYKAKEYGRNRFVVYQEGMQLDRTAIKGIDSRKIVEMKTCEEILAAEKAEELKK